MKRGASSVPKSKLDQIKSGGKTKKQVGGVKESKNVIHGKGGKYTITETEKKFEESGVSRKKRNYVMYEAKLGTEKERGLKKLHSAPKPRKNEQIVQTRKKVEYLDNYQYHETKNIKNPKKASIVTHQRLGDIVGGVYEEHTYQRMTMNDSGRGPKLYSEQTTKTTSRRGPQGQPTQTTQRTTASRTVPAQSRDYRKETKKNAAPSGRGNRTTTTITKTTTTRSSSRPNNPRGNSKTTTTTKTVTRGQSAGGLRGRRH